MKTFIAGIIGAAVAAIGWIGIEQAAAQEFPWLASVVGLITGIAVRSAAGGHSGESIGRGALAAILALAACFGSFQLKVLYLQKLNKDADKPQVAQVADGIPAEDGEAASEEVADVPTNDDLERMTVPAGKPKIKMDKDALKQWELLWLSLSAVLAYVIGKGSNAAAPPAEQSSPDDSAPEESGSDSE